MQRYLTRFIDFDIVAPQRRIESISDILFESAQSNPEKK